jgi:hypothetical protein
VIKGKGGEVRELMGVGRVIKGNRRVTREDEGDVRMRELRGGVSLISNEWSVLRRKWDE